MQLPHQIHRAAGTVGKTTAHIARVRAAQKRERKKLVARSPKWRTARIRHLKKFPACEACGSKQGLQVHHEVPFHVDPKRELDPANLVTLCEVVGGLECHEFFGHAGSFRLYNPNVRADSAELREHPERLVAIRARIKANTKR